MKHDGGMSIKIGRHWYFSTFFLVFKIITKHFVLHIKKIFMLELISILTFKYYV